MENLPKVLCTPPVLQNDLTCRRSNERVSKNCNICRNFKNVNDLSHRLSKQHQGKLTERFKIIKLKMKMIKEDAIILHDEQWKNEDCVYCYFCDTPIRKHQNHKEFIIENLGFLTHLADSTHMESVRTYLKYHRRTEDHKIFCRTMADLEKFKAALPEAERKYLLKLEFLNQKDIKHIKEIELQRKLLVKDASEMYMDSGQGAWNPTKEMNQTRTNKMVNVCQPKIPPWLLDQPDNASCSSNSSNQPVIGPTMENLQKHVNDLKKKGLPANRVGANFKSKSSWPAFGGVWNKGRRRGMRWK